MEDEEVKQAVPGNVAREILCKVLELFRVPNLERKQSIVRGVFNREMGGNSVWDENSEDRMDPLNRYEVYLFMLPACGMKDHFCKRLLAFDFSHKIKFHGRDDLIEERDRVVTEITAEEPAFQELAAVLPMTTILAGIWG